MHNIIWSQARGASLGIVVVVIVRHWAFACVPFCFLLIALDAVSAGAVQLWGSLCFMSVRFCSLVLGKEAHRLRLSGISPM